MRSTDLSARARIREAALVRFAEDGFDVGLRAIASDAGVSPALIVHHFGSKDGLRAACDEHVSEVVTHLKLDSVGPGGPEQMLAQLAGGDEHAHLAAYAVASLAAGGPLARRLVDLMTRATLESLEAGVAQGTIRPSRDPGARARYLTEASLGHLLLAYRHAREAGPVDLATLFAQHAANVVGPVLELFTAGIFTDDGYLRAYEAATTPTAHDQGDES